MRASTFLIGLWDAKILRQGLDFAGISPQALRVLWSALKSSISVRVDNILQALRLRHPGCSCGRRMKSFSNRY